MRPDSADDRTALPSPTTVVIIARIDCEPRGRRAHGMVFHDAAGSLGGLWCSVGQLLRARRLT